MINIVLSKLSRFDRANEKILCGPAETLARQLLAEVNIPLEAARVSTLDNMSLNPAWPVLFTGSDALGQFRHKYDLNAERGFVYPFGRGNPAVHSYSFQDAADRKDYESASFDPEESDADDGGNGKDYQSTARSNYRFYLSRDIHKLFAYSRPSIYQERLIYPSPQDIEKLFTARDRIFYLDIETHPETNTLQCLSWAFDNEPVITDWVYNHRGELNPHALRLLAGLARTLARNLTVVHNGAGFDLPFLAMMHGVPFGRRIYDTMYAGHRIFPEAEKSLAHQISLWANRPFHKDEAGTFHPRNWSQLETLLLYNMKDVDAMRDVHIGQVKYAHNHPGLKASIQQVNESAYTYALTSLTGFRIDTDRRDRIISDNTRRVNQLQRILNRLVGGNFNPGSPKQCAQYFHEGMSYPVLERSDTTNEPSIGGDVLYRFRLHYSNPAIDVILKMREINKSTSQLKFKTYLRRFGR